MIVLSLPSWVRTVLGWINVYLRIPPWSWSLWGYQVLTAGEWLSLNLNVGDYILYGLDAALSEVSFWVNWLWSVIQQAWIKAQQAYDLALALGAKIIQNIYQTINNVYQTITNVVNNVYQNIYQTVNNIYQTFTSVYQTINNYVVGVTEDYVQRAIASALSSLAVPLNIVSAYAQDIAGFFSNPIDWLLDRIDTWLNEKVEA